MKPEAEPARAFVPSDAPAEAGEQLPREQVIAAALRLLASIFQQEVDHRLLADLQKHRNELLTSFGGDALAGLDLHDPDAAVEALAVDYCRLFIGPSGHLPPVESIVLGEGRFWGSATEEVAKCYSDLGVSPLQDSRMFPDHISMELDCLATLGETGDHQRAKAFAHQHLLRWVPLLVDHVVSNAVLAFYPTWAKVTRDLLAELYDR